MAEAEAVKQAATAFVDASLERDRMRADLDAAQARFEKAYAAFFAAVDALVWARRAAGGDEAEREG